MLAEKMIVDAPAKTDEELAEMFRAEMLPLWIKELTKLWTAFRKVPTADELTFYKDQLSEIPYGLLKLAVKRVIAEHEYSNVPLVSEVWKALRKELHCSMDDLPREMIDWCNDKLIAASISLKSRMVRKVNDDQI